MIDPFVFQLLVLWLLLTIAWFVVKLAMVTGADRKIVKDASVGSNVLLTSIVVSSCFVVSVLSSELWTWLLF